MSENLIYDANSKRETLEYEGYEEYCREMISYGMGEYIQSETQMATRQLERDMIQEVKREDRSTYNGLTTLSYDDVPESVEELHSVAQRMQEENNKINEPITNKDGFLNLGRREDDGMVDQMMNIKEAGIRDWAIDAMVENGELTEEEAARLKDGEEDVNEEAEANLQEIVDNMMDNYPHPYLVRGADLRCTHGSHSRKLNLPLDHAVYVTGEPLIHKLDCIPGDTQNIATFGVCGSPVAGEGKPQPSVLLVVDEYDENGNVIGQKNKRGPACIPQIVGTWQNVFEEMRIIDNGKKDASDKLKDTNTEVAGYEAVTVDSFLVCKCQGHIYPTTSGQKEDPPEATYSEQHLEY